MSKKQETTTSTSPIPTPEQIEAYLESKKLVAASDLPKDSGIASELVQALAQAITLTRPVEKKNAVNRKAGTPWTPKDGSPKTKLKRVMYQHGLLIDADMVSNEDLELLNKLKPGLYMNGHVKVIKRKDWGIDIDYPVRTASQRLKLVNQFGIRNFGELLQRCIDEAANPKQYAPPEDFDS